LTNNGRASERQTEKNTSWATSAPSASSPNHVDAHAESAALVVRAPRYRCWQSEWRGRHRVNGPSPSE
jgi:hypothetical protein